MEPDATDRGSTIVEIVTEPFDCVTIPMLDPACRYEVPSESLVREAERLVTVAVSVVLL